MPHREGAFPAREAPLDRYARPKTAQLETLKGVERDYDLRNGTSLLEDWENGARFEMSDDFPRQIALADLMPNAKAVFVISAKARKLFEGEGVTDAEYLHVHIINHKGRKVPEPYFVLNPLRLVDCADGKKTKYRLNRLDKNIWDDVENLTIDEKRIPKGAKLVSVFHFEPLILIHRTLAEKMTSAKLTGYRTVELSEYRWF